MELLKWLLPVFLVCFHEGIVRAATIENDDLDLTIFTAEGNKTGKDIKKDIFGCPLISETASCDLNLVKFFIFTPQNQSGQEVNITLNGTDLKKSVYNTKNPTKILIHGFNTNWEDVYLRDIRQGYLNSTKALNVIMADYSVLVPFPCYIESVYNIKYVGQCIAKAITIMRKVQLETTGQDLDVHIVGVSLGGELPVYIAEYLEDDYVLPRVTGLDPAGPLFTLRGAASRLNPSVARFVDVLHTNGLLQGSLIRLGHADFYMNGGITQPGCYLSTACDHQRAPQYFAESINSTVGFYGFECSSLLSMMFCQVYGKQPVLMGEHCNTTTHGIFYLRTNSKKPYAKGMYF